MKFKWASVLMSLSMMLQGNSKLQRTTTLVKNITEQMYEQGVYINNQCSCLTRNIWTRCLNADLMQTFESLKDINLGRDKRKKKLCIKN